MKKSKYHKSLAPLGLPRPHEKRKLPDPRSMTTVKRFRRQAMSGSNWRRDALKRRVSENLKILKHNRKEYLKKVLKISLFQETFLGYWKKEKLGINTKIDYDKYSTKQLLGVNSSIVQDIRRYKAFLKE